MIRRPPRSTLDRSSAASDVYKRQVHGKLMEFQLNSTQTSFSTNGSPTYLQQQELPQFLAHTAANPQFGEQENSEELNVSSWLKIERDGGGAERLGKDGDRKRGENAEEKECNDECASV
eukprot:TRINITY_DN3688_c0_g1_i2.p1 TRINITY_DN3688_c0_g1~~TRINITY_DN3688_c0_g1_i2.p1  ORF type:complete len:126 (+),score=31.96 TRINITY_DN3688_c0_g1_i2:23-379(+)